MTKFAPFPHTRQFTKPQRRVAWTAQFKQRRCVNPSCGSAFTPAHAGHYFCTAGCHDGLMIHEIGASASGMRPFGMFGDRVKIRSFHTKWGRVARRQLREGVRA